MFNFVMSALLILGAVLGGGATTVAAAQDAQPNEILYPVKTWSEDVRIGWETDPQEKIELALQLTARRADEINNLLAAGEVIPEPVLNRFQNQQQQAVQFAFGLPEELVAPALERVREQARQQEQAMQQLHLNDPACEQLRERVRDMLRTQAQTAQTGIDNPEQLRDQLRLRLATPTLVPGETSVTTPAGGNPWTTGTPTPGSSYGPGEPQHQPDEPPAPGPSYGPGEITPSNGTPSGAGNGDPQNGTPQNGDPQNGNPQNGDPGGNRGSGSGNK